jgi:dTDP-4-dehydrorhamnose reductase
MKILITGANGQLAQEFQRLLGIFQHEMTALDKKTLDITDPESTKKVLSQYNPDIVLNCAAYNFVDRAEEDFDTAYKVNAQGVRNLALACKRNNALLVHYSSDYVFDGKKEDFYTEEDETNPVNNYGKPNYWGKLPQEDYENSSLFRVSWSLAKGSRTSSINCWNGQRKTGY